MLHLLDPDNYGLDDLESFRHRVENRHELARAFVLFREGQSFRLISKNASRLRDLLRDDTASIAILDELVALGRDSPQEEVDRYIRELRVAITDRHRIHYRMLRNRRDEVHGFAIRGRQIATEITAPSAASHDLAAWLDRWRNALVIDAEGKADNFARVAAEHMLEAALSFPEALGTAVTERLAARGPTSESSANSPGPEERSVLEAWRDYDFTEVTDARTKAIVRYACDVRRPEKVVVFSSFEATAKRIAAALLRELAENRVALHIDVGNGGTPVADGDAAIRRFRQDRNCTVLVCDASAEEGLNLQFADILVHADLPLDPNRLEQRIGRLDRHGPGAEVQNVIVRDGLAHTYLDAWADTLRDGFGVFVRSISSFQFVVDGLMPQLVDALVEDGPAGVARLASGLPERLESERTEIAAQDELDAIEAIALTHPVANKLRDLDGRWDEMEAYHERLICTGKGQLGFPRRPHYEHAELCSYWEKDPLTGAETAATATGPNRIYERRALPHRRRTTTGRAVRQPQPGRRSEISRRSAVGCWRSVFGRPTPVRAPT